MKDATFYRVKARGEFEDKIDTRAERRFVFEIVGDEEVESIPSLAEREITEYIGTRFPKTKVEEVRRCGDQHAPEHALFGQTERNAFRVWESGPMTLA
jgi:hypothetical protein